MFGFKYGMLINMAVLQSMVSDIHVVCGCLKDFLRSLKEPLVTFRLWNSFAGAIGKRLSDEPLVKLLTRSLIQITVLLLHVYDGSVFLTVL